MLYLFSIESRLITGVESWVGRKVKPRIGTVLVLCPVLTKEMMKRLLRFRWIFLLLFLISILSWWRVCEDSSCGFVKHVSAQNETLLLLLSIMVILIMMMLRWWRGWVCVMMLINLVISSTTVVVRIIHNCCQRLLVMVWRILEASRSFRKERPLPYSNSLPNSLKISEITNLKKILHKIILFCSFPRTNKI